MIECQKLSNDFALYKDRQNNHFLISESFNITIKIKNGGYIPKSGILLAHALNKLGIKETVLDIGTGETGFLAYYLLSKGANKVVACDIDQEAINHAQTASLDNDRIIWKVSDIYSNLPNLKFDLIVSNPPQMPMSNPGQPHDYGGIDGRDIILNIIEKSHRYINHNGKIVFLCFDFLGVTERFNSNPSITEIANKSGFRCKVIEKHKRYIRKGGKTEENLEWIQKIYPLYIFKKTPVGNYFHEILILELNKT